MKYKKVLNNENAIEIDGKVVISFDPRYKEYLKWKDENPDLEQQLVDEVEQEIKNKELYNSGGPHVKIDKNGKRQGKCIFYFENGNKKWEGEYKDDVVDGEVLQYDKDENLESKEIFVNDKKSGYYCYYEITGEKLTEGYLKDGKENGKKITYFEGKVHFSEIFKNGKLNGLAKYNTLNGKREREGIYKDGKVDGKWIFYYENKNKKWEGNFKDGVIEGELIQYTEDGNLELKWEKIMKNIIILGSSRSGKSTLAKKLFFLSGNHSILSLDYIRSGFKRVFPQLHINDRDSALGGSGMKDDFPLFVKTLLRKSSKIYYIVEGDSIKFEKAVELFTSDDNIIVFIGRNKISEDELFNEIRKYDIPNDEWTLMWDDGKLQKYCKNYIKISLENEKKCNENNIMYFDVSFKFEETLDSIANTILQELNKSIKI